MEKADAHILPEALGGKVGVDLDVAGILFQLEILVGEGMVRESSIDGGGVVERVDLDTGSSGLCHRSVSLL